MIANGLYFNSSRITVSKALRYREVLYFLNIFINFWLQWDDERVKSDRDDRDDRDDLDDRDDRDDRDELKMRPCPPLRFECLCRCLLLFVCILYINEYKLKTDP